MLPNLRQKEGPIDASDAIAKRHDMNYASVHAYDVVEDTRTLDADNQMISETQRYLYSIPFQMLIGMRVPKETALSALSQNKFIGILADYKEWKKNYMLNYGLDPTSVSDNQKISLDNWSIRLSYIKSDKSYANRRSFNLSILLMAKSQTRDEEKKK